MKLLSQVPDTLWWGWTLEDLCDAFGIILPLFYSNKSYQIFIWIYYWYSLPNILYYYYYYFI